MKNKQQIFKRISEINNEHSARKLANDVNNILIDNLKIIVDNNIKINKDLNNELLSLNEELKIILDEEENWFEGGK